MTKETEALKLALETLEEIALAGMSPSPEMSDIGIDAWHARQAWRFIRIAARALDPIKEALVQPEQPTLQEQLDEAYADMAQANADKEKASADCEKAYNEAKRIEKLIEEKNA
jgi:nitroreductase